MGGGTSLATVTSVCVVKRHGLIGLSRKDPIIIKRTLTEKQPHNGQETDYNKNNL